ncbi:CmeA [Campylobacter geochelonis]|nr:CmeA [Campylobacter geochelonis]
MKQFKKMLIFASCLLFITGCNMPWSKNDSSSNKAATQMPPAQVGVFEAKKENVPVSFSYPAQVVSNQDVNVVAKVSGTLLKQYFKSGDMVKTGDKLFLIDPDKYQAVAEIAAANLALSNANLDKARLDFNRAKKLKASNSISQQEYDNAVASFKSAQAQIKSAQASLNNANIDLNYTVVTAPFDGVLGDNLQDVGAYVSMQNPNLVRLTKLNPIYAKFAIADVDALNINQKTQDKEWVQKNALATLKVGNSEYNGTVTFIDKVINDKTGSVDAKAEFSNENSELMPGNFATVTMNGLYQKDGFKIPQIAIMQDLTSPFVYIIKDSKVTKAPITIVYQDSEFAVVSKGLNQGDKIIIDNFKKIRLGAPVVEAGK